MNPCPNCGSPVTGPICQNCGYNVAQMPQQQYQQPYQRQPPRPLPRKLTTAFVIALIALIMLFIAGGTGWWSMSIEGDVEEEWGSDYSFEGKYDFTLEEVDFESKTNYDGDSDSDSGDVNLMGDMEDVGDTTSLLMTLGIIMMILVVVLMGLLVAIVHTRSFGMAPYVKLMKNLALLFTLLALIFVLIAPVYYMVTWPETFEDETGGSLPVIGSSDEDIYDGSFMGSSNFDYESEWDGHYSGDLNWGPGIGWILAFVCLILLIITLGVVKTGGDEAMRMTPAPQPMPQQQYGGYGQQQPGPYQPPTQYPPSQPPQQPPQYPQQPPQYQ